MRRETINVEGVLLPGSHRDVTDILVAAHDKGANCGLYIPLDEGESVAAFLLGARVVRGEREMSLVHPVGQLARKLDGQHWEAVK